MAIYRTWADKSELPTELRKSSWMTVNKMPNLRDGDTITIDTQHMFTDQCNVGNMRLFDSAEMLYANGERSGSGYYLELEPHDIAARNETLKCGFCGQHYGEHHESHLDIDPDGDTFCRKCVGSEYLTLDNVKQGLNQLYRVAEMRGDYIRKPTQQEFEKFLPLYDHAQAEARKLRIEKRKQLERERIEKDLRNAKWEHDGKMWLLDRDYEIDNVIAYSHTGKFCFGWRNALTHEEELHLLDTVLVNAPFEFELKVR
tara:strand:- start:3938 stop:4708 length:771 start_codon:yes stop_codon:yes gene_type:complete